MKKLIVIMATLLLTTSVTACPTVSWCNCEDLTGSGYYDSMGHYCEYSGYWDSGCWIQTVGYWEGGCWYPAQYDPMLEVGYYDEWGQYHSYGYSGYCDYGYQDCGYSGYCDYDYQDCGYHQYDVYDTWACDNLGYYEDYGYDNYWIDVDLDADVIQIINNGVVVFSGTCTCTSAYRGQELAFSDQRCAGIWNCSGGFYDQACGYVGNGCPVRCH